MADSEVSTKAPESDATEVSLAADDGQAHTGHSLGVSTESDMIVYS